MHNYFDLTDGRIMVTGASSGIGRASAIVLSRMGASVVLVGRDEGRLAETRALLEGDCQHMIAPYDFNGLDGVSSWIKSIATQGRLTGLVHAAGIHSIRPLRELEAEELNRMLSINVTATIALIRGFRQKGLHQSPSSVVVMASAAASIGQAGLTAYSASKGALIAGCRAIAVELACEKIRVNTISPGIVQTEMTDRAFAAMDAEAKEAIFSRHLLGVGRAEDVAMAVAFLLSPASRWITGTDLVVDGGFSCH